MDDLLELLLPGTPPSVRARARTAITFLRLVVADSRPARASEPRPDGELVRSELQRVTADALGESLDEAIRLHLIEALGPETFACLARPSLGHQRAWSRLEEVRSEVDGLPEVPRPGEGAADVAERLIDGLARLAPGDHGASAWRCYLLWAREGAAVAAAAFSRELAEAAARGAHVSERSRLATGLVAAELERGAVRQARSLLDLHLPLASGEPELARLLGWSALLCGDLEVAADLLRGARASAIPVPRAIAELRERVPAWRELLAGADPAPAPSPRGRDEPCAPAAIRPCGRSDLGACFLGAFALGPRGEVQLVHVDVAPGLRSRVPRWIEGRDGAARVPGELEHALVASAEPVFAHALDGIPLRGALAPESARSIALAPIADDRGLAIGFVRVECEHHLLPSRARLLAIAGSFAPAVAAAADAGGHAATAGVSCGAPAGPVRLDAAEEDPRAEYFRELIARLGMKTATRRWWGFEWERGELALVDGDGGELVDWQARPGGQRLLLLRAATSGAPLRFDEPAPAAAACADSASGVALPILIGGTVRGVLAIESARRRDFRDADVERWGRVVAELGPALRLAQFRHWHMGSAGFDVYFDPGGAGLGARLGDILAAGRARRPVAICGPPGVGKLVVASWIHFDHLGHPRSGSRNGEIVRVAAAAIDAEDGVRRLVGKGGAWERAAGGTLVLEHLDRTVRGVQRLLAAELGRLAQRQRSGDPRLVATLRGSLAEACAAGDLLPELATPFSSLELVLPALAARRREIPELVRRLGRRFAREERVRAPEWSDDAMALLWRQTWEGNVRAIEQLVYKLVLLHPGAAIDAGMVSVVALRFGVELAQRLPTRQADPEVVRAALDTTRKQSGGANKTRAALYLGWDPDTLAARMKECAIDDEPAPARAAIPTGAT